MAKRAIACCYLVVSILWAANVAATVAGSSSEPCWCPAVASRLRATRALLEEKYTRAALDKAAFLFTDGAGGAGADPGVESSLVARLRACLESPGGQRQFRVGILGGSYALGKVNDGCWACNATRWLNNVLEARACAWDSHHRAPTLFDARSPSCPDTRLFDTPEGGNVFKGCPARRSGFIERPPTFCEPAGSFFEPHFGADKQGGGAAVGAGRVCDNDVRPLRPCTVFWGSGRHATITNGAQGGSSTETGQWLVSRGLDGARGLDLAIYDYGVNDFQVRRLARVSCLKPSFT